MGEGSKSPVLCPLLTLGTQSHLSVRPIAIDAIIDLAPWY
jgi:hypothetical protein